MKVFKFGGASVKDANAVKNVAQVLSNYKDEELTIVVSAMGKTTNALEGVVRSLCERDESKFTKQIEALTEFHEAILNDLFDDKSVSVHGMIREEIANIKNLYNSRIPENFNFEYDQIVSRGEILSTRIVSEYLNQIGNPNVWLDARDLIRTNNKYREAEVDWNKSEVLIKESFKRNLEKAKILITQGFIGHTSEGFTTTLGREGSDFTAGILAYCLDAESVTIWKDVPGMLNADPKWFDNTIKLDKISFREAIELSYYGASVIHPKTIKPLQNKQIPLYVKSFINPSSDGTVIQASTKNDHLVPSFIFKMNQILFSITPKDFSFLVEKNLSDIFDRLAKADAKINLMQNSALNFSILLDEEKIDIDEMLALFEDSYHIKFNGGLELVTIRHYDDDTINRVTVDKEILLEQKTRETARLIVRQI